MSIYKVDDGSTWYFDADSRKAARRQWAEAVIGTGSAKDETGAIEDFGEPEIRLVQLADAVKVKVTLDGETMECPHCCGWGHVTRVVSLLEAWQENQKLPADKRAAWGALCNSEWP